MHGNEFKNELADVLNCRRDQVDNVISQLPYGKIVAVAHLRSIEETSAVRETLCERERIFGNYEDGRYAWFLEVSNQLECPIPAKGNRLIWNWNHQSPVTGHQSHA